MLNLDHLIVADASTEEENRSLETTRSTTPVEEEQEADEGDEEETENRRQTRCSFCHEIGHNIRRCQCTDRRLLESRIREYTSNTEGTLFYLSSEDIEYRLFDEIHGYRSFEIQTNQLDENDMQRIASIPLRKRLQMLCIILNIPTSRILNTMVQRIINEVIRRRNEILESETEDARMLRMDAYRRQVINTLLTNGRAQLEIIEYSDIMHLHGKYKRYKTIMAQLGQTAEPEIQNLYIFTNISILNLKEQLRAAIIQYRLVYGEQEIFRLILKEIDGEFITIVKELVEDGEEWEDVECPICYENVESSSICMTNCFHKYCFHCLSKSLNTNKERKCPCCRSPITQIVNKSHVLLNDEMPDSIIIS